MKRSLLFLTLMTISSNLFSNDLDKKLENSDHQKPQYTNLDKLKIGSATFGAAVFAWAALLNHSAKKVDNSYQEQGKNVPLNFKYIPYYPSMISITPAIILDIFLRLFGNDGLSIPSGYNISTAYSSILACLLGSYAYKKFTSIKKKEGDKPSFKDRNL
jgi:hypothetical protein